MRTCCLFSVSCHSQTVEVAVQICISLGMYVCLSHPVLSQHRDHSSWSSLPFLVSSPHLLRFHTPYIRPWHWLCARWLACLFEAVGPVRATTIYIPLARGASVFFFFFFLVLRIPTLFLLGIGKTRKATLIRTYFPLYIGLMYKSLQLHAWNHKFPPRKHFWVITCFWGASGFFGGPVDFLIHWPPGPVVATVQCQGLIYLSHPSIPPLYSLSFFLHSPNVPCRRQAYVQTTTSWRIPPI